MLTSIQNQLDESYDCPNYKRFALKYIGKDFEKYHQQSAIYQTLQALNDNKDGDVRWHVDEFLRRKYEETQDKELENAIIEYIRQAKTSKKSETEIILFFVGLFVSFFCGMFGIILYIAFVIWFIKADPLGWQAQKEQQPIPPPITIHDKLPDNWYRNAEMR